MSQQNDTQAPAQHSASGALLLKQDAGTLDEAMQPNMLPLLLGKVNVICRWCHASVEVGSKLSIEEKGAALALAGHGRACPRRQRTI